MVVVVEILTTEGINLSAKSANDSGTLWELELVEILKVSIKNNNNDLTLRILVHF